MLRHRATNSHCTACWKPYTARPTKGATCSCDARRARRPAARRQLSAVPSPVPQLRGDRAGGGTAPPAGTAPGHARRVALGILVRVRDAGRRAVLARGRPVALHALFGARVPRNDRAIRPVARAALLARGPRTPALPGAAAVGRPSGGLDGGRMGGGAPGRHPVPLARARHLARRRPGAGPVGRYRWRAWGDALAGLVQCHARRSGGQSGGGRVRRRTARESRTPILTGGIYAEDRPDRSYEYFNAAFYFDSSGAWRRYPVYEKRYLVPVVERVPFVPARLMQGVPGIGHWSGGFGRGRSLPLYPSTLGRFGVAICYESAFEELARAYRRPGGGS